MLQDFIPTNILGYMASVGYIGSSFLILFWISIEVAELTRSTAYKTKHFVGILLLLCLFTSMIFRGWSAATGLYSTESIYVSRLMLVLSMLLGWIFTILYLFQRSTMRDMSKDEGMKVLTGRPEPLLNTAILSSLGVFILLLIISIWFDLSPGTERLATSLLALISPLLVTIARRWVTPVSSPRAKDNTPLIRASELNNNDNQVIGELPKG